MSYQKIVKLLPHLNSTLIIPHKKKQAVKKVPINRIRVTQKAILGISRRYNEKRQGRLLPYL